MRTHVDPLPSCAMAASQLIAVISELPWARTTPQLRHGDVLFRQGDLLDTIAVPLNGLLALRSSHRDRRATLMLLRRGTFVDDSPLTGPSRARFDAVAVTDSTVLSVPAADLWHRLAESPRFTYLWLTVTACRFAEYQRRLSDLLAGDIRSRVASLVLHETGEDSSTALTHQMMADLLGVQRSSVSRALADLERRGTLSCGYAHLRVRDRRALERAALGYATCPSSPLRSAS
ncbi:Crp/Fnr family transcriptional regulator [Haloechinothrix sp. LS1_15]|uniref:Crp/Fnr family transcriptional regulator n=1 Tax=Haloechinothrix sp. LS1_15 TaxID=2652248 RepID=UPI002946B36D|nr:Crp/Fnr family transcriptional regulator [Haloechinothrix sp. LS1_15]MDV6013617.1 Crp/Fnr family transcriptional regulator [Haloechinothrix sp. LS1_15]